MWQNRLFAFIDVRMNEEADCMKKLVLNPLADSGVEEMIRVVRGKQVLLDRDLAMLYGVETKRINEQVKRNIERFPEEFCFQLNLEEASCSSKSQIATLNASGNVFEVDLKEQP